MYSSHSGYEELIKRDFLEILSYLSKKPNENIPLFEIRDKVGINMTLNETDPHVNKVHLMLLAHDKVRYDEESKFYMHAAKYLIQNEDDLVALLDEKISIKWEELKSCHLRMAEMVKSLSKARKVLIIYRENDATKEINHVHRNQFRAQASCQAVELIPPQFSKIFFNIKVPDDVDLDAKLIKYGLRPHMVLQDEKSNVKKEQSSSKKSNYRFKLTNTHLDL